MSDRPTQPESEPVLVVSFKFGSAAVRTHLAMAMLSVTLLAMAVLASAPDILPLLQANGPTSAPAPAAQPPPSDCLLAPTRCGLRFDL